MAEYFQHDYDAQFDDKIEDLIADMDWEGYGLYWAIVERSYRAGGSLDQDYKKIASKLKTDIQKVQKVVENFKLFVIKEKKIVSKSILKRIKHRKKISKERSVAGKKGRKIQLESERAIAGQNKNNCWALNKIKEKKIKENKSIVKTDSAIAPQEPEPPKPLVKKEPVTPQAKIGNSFEKLYFMQTKEPYKLDSKHYIILAKLIKRFGYEKVVEKSRILAEYCNEKSEWFTQGGWKDFTVEKLSSQWNALLKQSTKIDWMAVLKKKERENAR